MKKILSLLFLLYVLSSSATTRVLVLAERGGLHEPFTARGLQWLEQNKERLHLQLTIVNDAINLAKGDIARHQLILQLNHPPYAWSEDASKEFQQYIDNGKGGYVGLHHATLLGSFDGYGLWQWFSDFMGGIVYKNYIAQKCDGTVQVEDPTHPVMQGVATTFVIPDDEWYIYEQNPRRNVHVLAHVDEASYTTDTDIRMGDHPVVWTNTAKPARNVYFQFGHSALLWDNAAFLQLFENAIRWAAGTTTEHP
ncbi:MAG: ThuA domain-containing protein [Prevotella sp.]|nr:ThuA domain-containing protein [Prevotella sp.]MBR6997899.1 ThuA domain-containing protein [Prevotella sp.]